MPFLGIINFCLHWCILDIFPSHRKTSILHLYDDNISSIIIFIIYSTTISIKINNITFFYHLACRTCAASRRKHPPSKSYLMSLWKMCGDKEFLSFISGKIEWESPPSILVTRNPNWSQRSGTKTSCVKERY